MQKKKNNTKKCKAAVRNVAWAPPPAYGHPGHGVVGAEVDERGLPGHHLYHGAPQGPDVCRRRPQPANGEGTHLPLCVGVPVREVNICVIAETCRRKRYEQLKQ